MNGRQWVRYARVNQVNEVQTEGRIVKEQMNRLNIRAWRIELCWLTPPTAGFKHESSKPILYVEVRREDCEGPFLKGC